MPKSKNIRNIAITIVLLVLSFGLIRSTFDVYKGGRRLDDLKKEVFDLENKKKELEGNIEYKQTNEFIEERARNDLNLIMPGESVFVVSGPDSEGFLDRKTLSNMNTPENKELLRLKEANWYKWYKLFF